MHKVIVSDPNHSGSQKGMGIKFSVNLKDYVIPLGVPIEVNDSILDYLEEYVPFFSDEIREMKNGSDLSGSLRPSGRRPRYNVQHVN